MIWSISWYCMRLIRALDSEHEGRFWKQRNFESMRRTCGIKVVEVVPH